MHLPSLSLNAWSNACSLPINVHPQRLLPLPALLPPLFKPGVPNSGKSEWVDALAVNLAEQFGFKTVFCSLEKGVVHHARHLLEKHFGKPFFHNVRKGERQRRLVLLYVLHLGIHILSLCLPLSLSLYIYIYIYLLAHGTSNTP